MVRKTLLFCTLAAMTVMAMADKTMYVPNEWLHPWNPDTLLYSESDPDNSYTWSKSRSRETDNVIVLWDKYYGNKAPDQLPTSSPYYVDVNDLLAKCEAFFDLELNTLGFVDPQSSNLSRYKVMVLMNHTTDWACYGGGYDYQVSALWLSPSTCKPVGHSVAHEIGHSFHYMCYAEASGHGQNASVQTGFHSAVGQGSVTWEQTAQWQANQSYPGLMFSQSIGVFRKSHNLAFTHEWHRYQSYWFFYYLCQYLDNIKAVANVWNYKTNNVLDFNQALIRSRGWTVEELYRRYYDYAARCATWDLDAARQYRNAYVGDFEYRAVRTADRTYQVAAASAPETTGFNVIPLQLAEAGTAITVHFTALKPTASLAEGDPGEMLNGETQLAAIGRATYPSEAKDAQKGFRLGFVALMKDGTRQYINADSVYCRGTGEQQADVTMEMPAQVSKLWMIVSPAPTAYNQHKWDDSPLKGDYIWPYRMTLEGTDILTSTGKATIYVSTHIDEADPHDVLFSWDVRVGRNSTYATASVTLSPEVQQALAYAFQLQPNQIASKLMGWSNSGPTKGRIMYCTSSATGIQANVADAHTNATYGHWFGPNGELKSWGSGAVVFCDFDPATLTFNIGYHPVNARQNTVYTITPTFQYRTDDGELATARFQFHVSINTTAQNVVSTADITDAIVAVVPEAGSQPSDAAAHTIGGYDLMGRPALPRQRGLHVIDGRKVLVR